jgi:hypothetical protein
VFNVTHTVPGFDMTIDQILVYIPQLTAKKIKLYEMKTKLPKTRDESTYKKIGSRMFYAKRIAAAVIILALLSAFIPNTPVNALALRIFSFVPGLGIIQGTDEGGSIKSVLNEPVKVTEGDRFVEIKTAYITGRLMKVSIKTNVGSQDAEKYNDPAEFKEFFAGETAQEVYLLGTNGRIKSGHTVRSGASFETGVYSIEANFLLGGDDIDRKVFSLIVEGFNKEIKITLAQVNTDSSPEALGNAAVIDNVMILANVSRQDDVLEVLLSSVAPNDYQNIRFHLYDEEKQSFKDTVHITDKDGNNYLPDEETRLQNNADVIDLYFKIPQNKEGLKLVIPQILYARSYNKNDIKINMPEPGRDTKINKVLDLNGSVVTVEKASLIPSNDPILPADFKKSDCLRVDAVSRVGNNSRESVMRVVPNVEIPDGFFKFIGISQSANSELWTEEQRGYSLVAFEKMEKTKKILLKFDVEYVMSGPCEIEIR